MNFYHKGDPPIITCTDCGCNTLLTHFELIFDSESDRVFECPECGQEIDEAYEWQEED